MQILIISSKFPYPLKDGGAIATYNLARGLAERGNQVLVFSFNTNKHHISIKEIPVEKFKDIEYQLIEINTKINPFRAFINYIFSRKPYILVRFRKKSFGHSLAKLLNERQFDVVQIEGLYMMQYAALIKAHTKAKIAYRPHNLEHRIWSLLSENASNWFKKMYFNSLSKRIFKYEKTILNSYDAIVPISPFDASYYEGIGNTTPLAVIPTGFDLDDYHENQMQQSKHKLFYIGSLEWIPNQEGITWFIKNCWEKLRLNFPYLELHIAGRNTPEWLISEYSFPGIFWAGEIEDVKPFVEDKTIMIVPLFSGSGLRIKIIEAFLNNKAVVASAIAVQGTGAADNCELLIADGYHEFINKISNLIRNEKLYKRMVHDAFHFACTNFDNRQISSELGDFYEKILSHKPNSHKK